MGLIKDWVPFFPQPYRNPSIQWSLLVSFLEFSEIREISGTKYIHPIPSKNQGLAVPGIPFKIPEFLYPLGGSSGFDPNGSPAHLSMDKRETYPGHGFGCSFRDAPVILMDGLEPEDLSGQKTANGSLGIILATGRDLGRSPGSLN
jgi:hypothetical protein